MAYRHSSVSGGSSDGPVGVSLMYRPCVYLLVLGYCLVVWYLVVKGVMWIW